MSTRRVPVEFTWHQYFYLAKELINQSCDETDYKEALLRSAIRRAYYATHCLARNYLIKDKGLTPPKKKIDMHKWVIDEIRKDSTIGTVHVQLSRLRDDRNRADYEDTIRGVRSIAEGAIRGAQSAIDTLDST